MSDLQLEKSKRFPSEYRLLTAKHYKQVFTNPLKASSRNFTLLAVANNLEFPRLGLIVAKKNIRFAVDRNRLKRLIRESFRQNNQTLPQLDLVILPRRGSSELSNQVLFDQIESLWKKIARKSAKEATAKGLRDRATNELNVEK